MTREGLNGGAGSAAMVPPDPGPLAEARAFAADLSQEIAGSIRLDAITRALYATDASMYQMMPLAVVVPRTTDDVAATVATAFRYGIPVLPRGGGSFWIRGASRAELWLRGPESLEEPVFLVESPVAGNGIRIAVDGAEETIRIDAGQRARVSLPVASGGDGPYRHRMIVETDRGEPTAWVRHVPPPTCPNFAWNESWEETFYLGARVVLLGNREEIEGDVYDAEVRVGELPQRIPAGGEISVSVEVVNRSGSVWKSTGAARVRLASRWMDGARGEVVAEGDRTELPLPMAPGEVARVELELQAPERPGRYLLRIEPLVEHVAWFSSRRPDGATEVSVRVLPRAHPVSPGASPP